MQSSFKKLKALAIWDIPEEPGSEDLRILGEPRQILGYVEPYEWKKHELGGKNLNQR